MTIEHEDLINMESSQDMTRPQIDKMDPRYITACIKQLPTLADPQEVEIIRVMEKEALSTSLARKMIEDEKKIITSNLRDLLVHLNDTSYTHAKSRQAVVEVAEVVNAKIVSGHEKLQGLEKGRPVFLSANHLGVYKLVGLSPDDLTDIDFHADHEIPSIYYSPIPFYAPFYPVAKELCDDVYIAAMEEPGHLGELSRATGYVDVPPSVDELPESNGTGVGRVEILTESSRKFFEERPDSAILVFPEGGTTGKRTGGNPYNLEKFHSGLFVIASKLEVPIVLLAHHFDPNKGFEVAVAGVTQLSKDSTREEIQKAASDAQELTQVTLDNMRAK